MPRLAMLIARVVLAVLIVTACPSWVLAEHSELGGQPGGITEFRADHALFTLIVFGILLLVLAKFAWGPITKALESREKQVADNIARAEELRKQAETDLSQYRQKLAQAQDEVRGLLEEARRDGEHTRQQMIAKTEADLLIVRDRQVREIETAKAQALKELAERSADLAIDLAGRIVHKQLSRGEHSQLIDEALERFTSSAHPSAN